MPARLRAWSFGGFWPEATVHDSGRVQQRPIAAAGEPTEGAL
jgi:hypothetical protein